MIMSFYFGIVGLDFVGRIWEFVVWKVFRWFWWCGSLGIIDKGDGIWRCEVIKIREGGELLVAGLGGVLDLSDSW